MPMGAGRHSGVPPGVSGEVGMDNNIILIGMPGSGKSSVGVVLAVLAASAAVLTSKKRKA